MNSFIASGDDGVADLSSGTGTLPAIGGDYTGMVGIIGDVGALVQQVAPNGYTTLVNTNTGVTAIIGAQSTTLVELGANSQLLYGNTASNASVFLGGGVNEVSNASADSSMTVNLSGPSSVGSAASAIVNGALGQTTVNVGNGAMLDVLQGAVSVVAQTGTATVEVSAPTSDVERGGDRGRRDRFDAALCSGWRRCLH